MKLVPDMIVCAKGLSSAYLPISALMINERVFKEMSEKSDEIGVERDFEAYKEKFSIS